MREDRRARLSAFLYRSGALGHAVLIPRGDQPRCRFATYAAFDGIGNPTFCCLRSRIVRHAVRRRLCPPVTRWENTMNAREIHSDP